MNTGVHEFFQSWFPQDICPVVGLLGHMDIFEGNGPVYGMDDWGVYLSLKSLNCIHECI